MIQQLNTAIAEIEKLQNENVIQIKPRIVADKGEDWAYHNVLKILRPLQQELPELKFAKWLVNSKITIGFLGFNDEQKIWISPEQVYQQYLNSTNS